MEYQCQLINDSKLLPPIDHIYMDMYVTCSTLCNYIVYSVIIQTLLTYADDHVQSSTLPLSNGCGSGRRLAILETLLHCTHVRPHILKLVS